eukprot:4942472-Heterocapsa_arctica.AAC.1
MVRHVKDPRDTMVEDQGKPWAENMTKLADWLQKGNENSKHIQATRTWKAQDIAMHILCKQWVIQKYHDKWKYCKKIQVNHIDTDEEHRRTTAEIIDFGKGDPTMDTHTLAKDKGGRRHLDMPN